MVAKTLKFVSRILPGGTVFALLLQTTACTTGGSLVPGMYMESGKTESDVEVPVENQSGGFYTEKAAVRAITAGVVVEQERLADRRETRLPPSVNAEYRIGPRDVLTITVWDHPELTIPAGEFRQADVAGNLVNEDGTFFYPYVGVVHAAGKTVPELRRYLTARLSKFIENVQLDVRIADYRSQRVYVVGEVSQPGIYSVDDVPMTLAEAINRAGGVTLEADQERITLARAGETYRLNLRRLYEEGDLRQNVLLQHGDVLNVWDNDLNKVFVMGEVRDPQSLFLNKGRKTLAEAISDAGGIDQTTSNPAKVFVVRAPQGAMPEIFHLDSKSPDAMMLADRFPLLARDVVYVDTAPVVRWNRVVSQILPTAQTLNQTSDVDFGETSFRP